MTGRTISYMIGEALTEAWRSYLDSQQDPWADESRLQRSSVARGRVLGLAQALAILHTAPRQPAPEQVRAVANEFKPEGETEEGS